MKAVGIIAEYNPCHNGHLYHISQSKIDTGSDCAVIIMSGDFMQRGAPAIMDKYLRAECAVMSGADLVIELPAVYATGSAELFARGAVSILNGLSGVSCISFGSECQSIDILCDTAKRLACEEPEYKEFLKKHISSGYSMPLARSMAFKEIYGNIPDDVLSSPNNILAIEYLKALIRTQSNIIPHNIVRRDNAYHDDFMTGSISSATAIRRYLESGDFEGIASAISATVCEKIRGRYTKTFPVTADDLSELLLYALRDKENLLADYADVSDAMAARIQNHLHSAPDGFTFSGAADAVKSKDITYTRVCRAFTHILLGIDKILLSDVQNAGFPSYARVLASSAKGREFLGSIRKTASIPVISNCHDDIRKLDDLCRKLLLLDIKAADIYNDIVYYKFGNKIKDDYRSRPLIL